MAVAIARRAPALFRWMRHPGLAVGTVLLAISIVVAVAAPLLSPYSPTTVDLANTLARPSAQHWLGTDDLGRDILSRLIWGSRVSLEVAFSVMAVSMGLGMFFGALAGFLGGWIERATVYAIDILLAFPAFLLCLAIVAARGSSLESIVLGIGIAYVPRIAAVMRAVVLTIAPRPYIEAARAIGLSPFRILLFHVIPNSLPPVIVVGSVSAATAILGEAGLSFLGVGVQPPTPTWGNIIADGRNYLASNPLISLSAGACIALAVIALNQLGDGLRDTLDPQMREQSGIRML